HSSTATRPEDGKPGYEYGAGTHFNPNITWWEQSGAFFDYLARCQHLLQSGRFVADVLYYNGDGSPNIVRQKHVPDDLGPGYDYDVCNTQVLLTRLAVEDRYLVLPDGVRYRALVLPESQTMTVEVARKLRELVRAGVTIIGPKPARDPGLKNYPQCDRELRAIAAELWGDCDGKKIQEAAVVRGRMVWGKSVREILLGDGISPDFQYPEAAAALDFIHRSIGDAELYSVVNRSNQPARVDCTFRIADREIEIWNPVTGVMQAINEFTVTNNCTVVPLVFAPYQSLFVVFRQPATRRTSAVESAQHNSPAQSLFQTLAGSWDVQFDPRWGGPASIKFETLSDWIERPEDGIRYYSGTATYRKRFDLNSELATDQKLLLDLGRVKNLAAVRLNGVNLGVVWTAPWQVEITRAVKPADNLLEIDVVNLWPNRLLGDAALPPEKRFTRTNIPLKKNARLLPSGLLGPVTILSAKQ
ncbi:MAG: glycosyl transferase family 2, partial [Verrucomicrobia subdivision 3 bacterium]|nr:glycosyl transferase family 2 [Limisphaerales bacterium]